MNDLVHQTAFRSKFRASELLLGIMNNDWFIKLSFMVAQRNDNWIRYISYQIRAMHDEDGFDAVRIGDIISFI